MSSASALLVGLIPLLLVPILFIVGLVLVLTSRSGGKRHPACGGCGYDITGTVGETDRCPECGRPFTEVGITPPKGHRNRLRLGLGIAFLAVSGTCLLGIAASLLMASVRQGPTVAPAPPPPPPAAVGTTDDD